MAVALTPVARIEVDGIDELRGELERIADAVELNILRRRAAALEADNARLLSHVNSLEARLDLAEDTIRRLTRDGR